KEARALGTAIDAREFFDAAIAAMGRGGEEGRRAFRLLADYAPDNAPKKPVVAEWEGWLRLNRPYLFFSDQGDYAWYIDPLAKKRGIPTELLRGPVRASRPRARDVALPGGN